MLKKLRAGLFVGVFAAMLGAPSGASAQMVLWVDPDGSTYLKNNGTKTLNVDGYTIVSENNDLIPGDYDGTRGWAALDDLVFNPAEDPSWPMVALGPGAFTFGSANPGPGNLSELSLHPLGAEFSPGEQWFIGKPFSTSPIDGNGVLLPGYAFDFKTVDVTSLQVGAIVPEPSTLLLASLAGLSLAVMRRRGLRSAFRRTK